MLISLYRCVLVITICILAFIPYVDRNIVSPELEMGAAQSGCYLNLVESEPLSFGAVVASPSAGTWISMDTDSNVTAQRNRSFVGALNSKKHRHRRGVVSLSGYGLMQGSQISVTFNSSGFSDGIILDNMQYDVASADNLTMDNSFNLGGVTFIVDSGGRVQADILYSGRLSLDNSIYGEIEEEIRVDGRWVCS